MNCLPTLVSALRLALAPLVFIVLREGRLTSAAPLVGLAILSDLTDGPLARRLGRASPRGGYLDASADFVFLSADFSALVLSGVYPAPLLGVMLAMFLQFALRPKNGRLAYDPVGKYYGAALYGALALTLLAPDLALARAMYYAVLVLSAGSLLGRFIQVVASDTLAARE